MEGFPRDLLSWEVECPDFHSSAFSSVSCQFLVILAFSLCLQFLSPIFAKVEKKSVRKRVLVQIPAVLMSAHAHLHPKLN